MTKNVAAWIPKAKAQLEVKEAPDWKVEKGEVLVEVRSVRSDVPSSLSTLISLSYRTGSLRLGPAGRLEGASLRRNWHTRR